jgi:hypothetical protein
MTTENYTNMFNKGIEYQNFVTSVLDVELGIVLENYSSAEDQLEIGENKQGIEIKFDDRYKDTGNLYIEVAEKSNKSNTNFMPSGIYRKDNSWVYLIGDYTTIFFFSKKLLKLFYEADLFCSAGNETSKGFLLKRSQHYLADKIITLRIGGTQ